MSAAAWPSDTARLLEPSISYALDTALAVTPELLARPTPWDISRACGRCRPIPGALAVDLLAIAQVLVPRTGRHPLFAGPLPVAATAGPSDRLAAFLGRSPGIAPMPGH